MRNGLEWIRETMEEAVFQRRGDVVGLGREGGTGEE